MIKGLTSLPSLVATARERGKTARTVVLTSVGVAADYVARWNGSSWISLGSGVKSSGSSLDEAGLPFSFATVRTLAVSGSNVYTGGIFTFTSAGGMPANSIAK